MLLIFRATPKSVFLLPETNWNNQTSGNCWKLWKMLFLLKIGKVQFQEFWSCHFDLLRCYILGWPNGSIGAAWWILRIQPSKLSALRVSRGMAPTQSLHYVNYVLLVSIKWNAGFSTPSQIAQPSPAWLCRKSQLTWLLRLGQGTWTSEKWCSSHWLDPALKSSAAVLLYRPCGYGSWWCW